MSEQNNVTQGDLFVMGLILIAMIAFVAVQLQSELRDAQRRLATLEQRCD